tara:strand:+ start:1558 stop:2115 length:558 start_codon:yes stop_codon:yes gene_type:complete
MFDSENKKSDITLCIFPNLKEFLVIDTRFGKDKIDENSVLSLSLDKLLDDKFHNDITDEFSKLIRTDDIDFMKLISLPKKVEKLLRNEVIKIIINELGIVEENFSQIGIIFFNKDILKLSKEQLKNALIEIFSDKTDNVFIENLSNKIMSLIKLEKDFVKHNYKSSIESIINENDESFITLWKKG